jgi:thiamine-monophosphate kinase
MIGGAGAGLALLRGEAGPWSSLAEWERDALVRRYRVPEPRTALAPALIEFASAAMDVSDGLVGDCDKLCAASGCSASIDADKVPLPPGLAGSSDAALIARLLTAGDDFEILAAIPQGSAAAFRDAAKAAGVPVHKVGALAEGSAVTKVFFGGRPLPLSRRAFVHGRAGDAK